MKLSPSEWKAAVPRGLRALPHWVGWRLGPPRGRAGKRPKLPVDPRSEAPADVSDPKTWGTWEDACRFYERAQKDEGAGCGFVLARGDGLIFIDLDHCLLELDVARFVGSQVAEWARPLVEQLRERTYVEVSPGGDGLHAFVVGDLPRAEGVTGVRSNTPGGGAVEVYAERRFFTVTGLRVGAKGLGPWDGGALAKYLGVVDRLERPPKESEEAEDPRRASDCAAALAALDPDCTYEDWVKVGMALRAGLGDAGLELWDAWSREGKKYVEGEPAEKWRSFQRGGIGLGSLFHMAREAGWRGRPEGPRRPSAREDFAAELADVPYHVEVRGKRSEVVRGPENVALYFSRDPAWSGRLALDVRRGAELDGHVLTDEDLARMSGAVSRAFHWSPAVGLDVLQRGVNLAAAERAHDPVADWLRALAWDGVPRLDGLAKAVGLEDSPAARRYLRRWMVGAVARALEPGCEMQNMLVLAGPQGAGKSRLLKALAVRPEWYRESEVALGSKDAQLAVLRPWVVEVGELSGMRAREVEAVRVFISEREGSFRAPYDRLDRSHPRRCVFAGSTNDDDFNRDAAGARRMWAVQCVAPELLVPSAEEVASLWAEARAAHDAGEPWWESGDEMRETIARGEERFARTDMDVALEEVLGELRAGLATTMVEVVSRLRAVGALRAGTHERDVARALRRAGWTLRRLRAGGEVRRAWVAPGVEHGARDACEEAVARVSPPPEARA